MALTRTRSEEEVIEPVQYLLVAPLEANEFVLPGIRFGRPDELLSPAYWAMRCATADAATIDFVNRHGSLEEEVGFCLLGGFGVKLEVATAFYERLKNHGAFLPGSYLSEDQIFSLLDAPALVLGRPHRYRFPKQRAGRLFRALYALSTMSLEEDNPAAFRNQLQSLEGVGPKTASWITRNWLGADDVAILDIHVIRACWHVGLFEPNCRLPNDYANLENRFLSFAKNLHVRTSVLDSVMWLDMRTFGLSVARLPLVD